MIDIGFAGAFVGGLLSLLSPCSVMLLPAFFAYAFGTTRQLVIRTGIFYLGLVASLVPLGVFASALGGLLTEYRQQMIAVVALLVMIAGLLLLLGVSIPVPVKLSNAANPGSLTSGLSTFLLGTVYAVAGACAGPILGSVLLVASLGNVFYGATIMALYALGMALPLLVLALLWGKLGAKGMAWLKPRTLTINFGKFSWTNSWTMIISGLLTIGVGALLFFGEGGNKLGSWLDVASQQRLENSVITQFGSASDLWFVVGAVLILALIYLLLKSDKPSEPAS